MAGGSNGGKDPKSSLSYHSEAETVGQILRRVWSLSGRQVLEKKKDGAIIFDKEQTTWQL